jgi:DNA-binding NtrC family response regulator
MSSRAEKEPITRPSERARGRVLVIADDKHPQFTEAVTAKGIDVFGVSNGAAAIVSLTRTRPHLVIADISTRGLRVRELAKMLAQSDDGIPLILTGSEA